MNLAEPLQLGSQRGELLEGILVVSAGTSDIPVAEETAETAQIMGNHVERLYDVGVAGLHRLLDNHEKLLKARVIVVVAGMEGALPSVVGGLVDIPVIAVPTSVGYGASFGGIAALLGMLNSCASGVTVVNIDNGFGAGYSAALGQPLIVGRFPNRIPAHQVLNSFVGNNNRCSVLRNSLTSSQNCNKVINKYYQLFCSDS